MCVLVVVGVLGILYNSSTFSVKVLLRAVLEVLPNCINTADKKPCLENLRRLHFATDLLASFTYRDRHR